MKIPLIILLCLVSVNLFAQDREHEEHKKHHKKNKHKSDYFAVGLYAGSYIGPALEKNFYFNSFAAEIEYFKFSDLSLYARGIYQLTNIESNYLTPPGYTYIYEEPFHYSMVISFGGRYYLRKEGKVKPYLQLGINQETQYKASGNVELLNGSGQTIGSYSVSGGYNFSHFLNIGIGFNIKISRRFNFDFKYDLNKSLEKTEQSFTGFSVLAGLKYNL